MSAADALSLPLVAAVAGDPGGANALTPVLRALEAEGRVRLNVYAYAEAVDSMARAGVQAHTLTGPPSTELLDDALAQGGAAGLLAATSVNERNWERPFVRRARTLGVPALALLDFWTNYRARFVDRDGTVTAPDVVAVMDQRAADGLRTLGLPSTIVVTGQPAHDELAALRASMTGERRRRLRWQAGVEPGDVLVLFASQPFCALRGTIEDMGYDEERVLALVVPALESVARATGKRLTLVIRPHPREAADAHARRTSASIRVVVSREGDGRDWAMAADLVIGMCTALLVEACYLGASVLSVQPGLCLPDPVPTNAAGLSTGVYRAEDVLPAVARLLDGVGAAPARSTAGAQPGATRRVLDCLYSLMLSQPVAGPRTS